MKTEIITIDEHHDAVYSHDAGWYLQRGNDRDEMRALQDQFLALPLVQRFVSEHGEHKSVWHLGPTVHDVRTMLYPQYRGFFRVAVEEHGGQQGD